MMQEVGKKQTNKQACFVCIGDPTWHNVYFYPICFCSPFIEVNSHTVQKSKIISFFCERIFFKILKIDSILSEIASSGFYTVQVTLHYSLLFTDFHLRFHLFVLTLTFLTSILVFILRFVAS